jgi:hypothetical protein
VSVAGAGDVELLAIANGVAANDARFKLVSVSTKTLRGKRIHFVTSALLAHWPFRFKTNSVMQSEAGANGVGEEKHLPCQKRESNLPAECL